MCRSIVTPQSWHMFGGELKRRRRAAKLPQSSGQYGELSLRNSFDSLEQHNSIAAHHVASIARCYKSDTWDTYLWKRTNAAPSIDAIATHGHHNFLDDTTSGTPAPRSYIGETRGPPTPNQIDKDILHGSQSKYLHIAETWGLPARRQNKSTFFTVVWVSTFTYLTWEFSGTKLNWQGYSSQKWKWVLSYRWNMGSSGAKSNRQGYSLDGAVWVNTFILVRHD